MISSKEHLVRLRSAIAKLNMHKAREIRALLANGHSIGQCAIRYGVSRATIHALWQGKTWKDQDGPTQRIRWHPMSSKLNREQARQIRAFLATGSAEYALAHQYGVSITTIRDIKHGRTWKENAV